MTAISTWSTTAASNSTASPDGAPENMAPSGLNNTIRENMAQVRAWYDTVEWRDFGHTIAYVSATSFKTTGEDTTGVYTVHRRVHANGSTTNDIYGNIVSSSFSTDTTVVIDWDTSNELQNEALTIEVGFDPTNQPLSSGGWEIFTASTAITAVAAYEVDITAGYDYRVEVYGAHADAQDGLGVQMYEGASYMGDADSYASSRVRSDNTLATGVIGDAQQLDTKVLLTSTDVPAAPPSAADRARLHLEVSQADNANIATVVQSAATHYDSGDSDWAYKTVMGNRVAAVTATKFKLFWIGGASFQANGYYVVYRRRNGN